MKVLLKINKVLGKVENVLLSAAILGICALMIANTLGRTIFHHSIHFTEELCMILILIVTFIGLSNATRHGRHIIMTAIYDRLPNKAKRISNIIVYLIIVVLLLWITWLSWNYTRNVYAYGRITTVLKIPVYLSMAIIPLGCLITAFQYLLMAILSIRDKDVIWVGTEKTEDPPIDEQVEHLLETEAAENENPDGSNVTEGGDAQ